MFAADEFVLEKINHRLALHVINFGVVHTFNPGSINTGS